MKTSLFDQMAVQLFVEHQSLGESQQITWVPLSIAASAQMAFESLLVWTWLQLELELGLGLRMV